jgi:hypothetical protein
VQRSEERADRFVSPAGRTPGHVLPGFTLATELLAEVELLLPRVAEG